MLFNWHRHVKIVPQKKIPFYWADVLKGRLRWFQILENSWPSAFVLICFYYGKVNNPKLYSIENKTQLGQTQAFLSDFSQCPAMFAHDLLLEFSRWLCWNKTAQWLGLNWGGFLCFCFLLQILFACVEENSVSRYQFHGVVNPDRLKYQVST